MIDLNKDEYDGGGGKAIPNEGKAGIMGGAKLSIKKKTEKDKENAPDYKLVYTTADGATAETGIWYVTKETKFKTEAQLIQAQGKVLKHVIQVVLGEAFVFPQYNSAKEMLDGIMKLIHTALPNTGPVRVFLNYGTKDYPKKYIQPRSWTPFIESETVDIAETTLKKGNLDKMEPITGDNFPAPKSDTAPGNAPVDENDDW